MEYKYTFTVRNFRSSKDTNIIKTFDEKLSNKEVKDQVLDLLFNSDNMKNVSFKCLEIIDELGNVIEKQKELYY